MLLSFSDFFLIFSGIFEIFSWISPFPPLIPKWCQGIKPLAEEATQGKIKVVFGSKGKWQKGKW
jgi:hypothetical protein